MFRLLFFSLILTLIMACNSTQTIVENKAEIQKAKAEARPSPISVSPHVNLNSRQTQILEISLPPNIREVLENAEEFEILAEMEKKDGKFVYPGKESFEPTIKAVISEASLRKEILENFYRDVSKGSEPANCWLPHHILRAGQGDKTVEMEICFSCSRFEGKGSFGAFSGTTGRGDEKTEKLFNRLIETYGVAIP
ncbi:MAG: hypothetical protein ABIU09_00400 [Pyrinomonadaceae bacterium]